MEREVEKVIGAYFDLNGATALITGGASGLGKATADRMLRSNANVVIADYSDEGKRVAEELDAKYSMSCKFIKTDVSKEEDIRRAVEFAVEEFGELNIAVCSAGIGGANNAIADETLANWEKVNAVDYTGVMLEAGQGRRHLQPGLHVRPGGGPEQRGLLSCQGRRRESDEGGRFRLCGTGHPRELRVPRRHQYPAGTGERKREVPSDPPYAPNRRRL